MDILEVSSITLRKSDYEDLVRDSERLSVLRDLVRSQKYINDEITRQILGVEYKKETEDAE